MSQHDVMECIATQKKSVFEIKFNKNRKILYRFEFDGKSAHTKKNNEKTLITTIRLTYTIHLGLRVMLNFIQCYEQTNNV